MEHTEEFPDRETPVEAGGDVLLIGNGPSALSSYYGGLIDSFQGKVVRFNLADTSEKYSAMVGSRTDVWVTNGGQGVRDIGQSENILALPLNRVGWNGRMWASFSENRKASVIEDVIYNEVSSEMGFHPTCGALVARHMLRLGSRVYLYGFDFLSNPKGHHYFPSNGYPEGHNPSLERAWWAKQILEEKVTLWEPDQSGYLIGQYESIYKSSKVYVSHARTLYREILSTVMSALDVKSVLDFGCGNSVLIDFVGTPKTERYRYDPAIPRFATLPDVTPDLLVTTDVLEHVPLQAMDSVLATPAINYLHAVCTREAVNKLPDGQNCHCTVRDASWWEGYLTAYYKRHMVTRLPFGRSDVVVLLASNYHFSM